MEENKNDSVINEESNDSNQETEAQFVKRQAYEEVSKDMHKYKSKLRDTEATANELASRLKAIEEEKLMEQQKWQELYEREKNDRERLAQERDQDKQLYLRSVKLSALKQELGGNVKDVYLQNADIDSIEIREDGTLSSDSVLSVANQFRNDFPEVIPQAGNTNITGTASPTSFNNEPVSITQAVSKMNTDQKSQFLKMSDGERENYLKNFR